jgi:hypothetical protein
VVALGINVMAPGFRDTLIGALCRDLVPARARALALAPVAAPLDTFPGYYVGGGDGWVRVAGTRGALELEIGASRMPGRLRARLVRRGRHIDLESDLPHLAVGLAATPEQIPMLMVGLTAFKRVRVSAGSR